MRPKRAVVGIVLAAPDKALGRIQPAAYGWTVRRAPHGARPLSLPNGLAVAADTDSLEMRLTISPESRNMVTRDVLATLVTQPP